MRIDEVEQRDPNKNYSKLDQEFRNRTKPRIDSFQKPEQFDFPGQDKLKGKPKAQTTRAQSGKNVTTDRAEADSWGLSQKDKDFFDTFDSKSKSEIARLGVTPVYRRSQKSKNPDGSKVWGYSIQTKTSNNVPVDINSGNNTLWMGGLNKPEQKEALLDAMKQTGFKIATTVRADGYIGFVKDGIDKYKALAEAIAVIESLGPDFKSSARGTGARAEIDSSSEPSDYYYKLANGLVNTYSTGQAWALSRGGSESTVGGFDANDNVIIVGYTKAGYQLNSKGKTPYREHAVPCDLINKMGINICKDMDVPVAKNGRFTDAGRKLIRKATHVVMNMIQRNLTIVLCSNEEASILDKDNGWQTTMPEGWKEGDNPLARFTKAKLPDGKVGIPVYSIKNLERIAEDN